MIRQTKIALRNWRFLAGWWAARLVMALIVAYPLAGLVGATGVAQYPAGDATLFDAGGMLAMDILRGEGPAISAVTKSGIVVTWIFAIVSFAPLALCYAALARGRRARLAEVLTDAVASLPAFVLTGGLAILAQVAVVVLLSSLIAPLTEPLRDAWPGPYADAALAGLALLGGLCAIGIGIACDLARAIVTCDRIGGWSAARRALEMLAARPARIASFWAGVVLVAAVLIALGAAAARAIDVSRPEPWRVAAVLATHQLVSAGLVVTRAVWLVRALELVGRRAEPIETGPSEPDDRSAGSDARLDPSSDPIA